MRIDAECPACLERLIRQTVEQATADEGLRRRALDVARETLGQTLTPERIPTQVAGEVQRVIRQVTGNRDPYREWKDREMAQARRLFDVVRPRYGDDTRSLLTLSVLGNAPDFFKDIAVVEQEMLQPVSFAVDHIGRVSELLEGARSTLFMADAGMDNLMCFVPAVNLCVKRVLFLADNAAECFFDQPLVGELAQVMRVSYVVKRSPVQNDLTMEDLLLCGLHDAMGARIVPSTDTAGTDLSLASSGFREEFHSADFILAKGMGNWETLSELPPSGKVFHLLVAKCPPVARSLDVPPGSYMALLR
ncbi:MAG: ARMT1-like domain-containing protein [Chloroflexota bacterium]